MDPIVQPALWVGVPLVLLLLFGRWSRRLIGSGLCVLFCLAAAVHFQVFHFQSTLYSAEWEPVWVLLAWIEFGVIARWAGGFPIRGPLGLLAFFGGALLGDLGAALLIAPRTPTPMQKARVVLTASAGALISPIGTPVTLLLVEPGAFGVLPFALAALSWPRGWAQDEPARTVLPLTQTGANRNLGILLLVVLGCLAGFSKFWVLGIGCVVLMIPLLRKGVRPPTPWGQEIWIMALAVVCFLCVASGALREAQIGLEAWCAQGAAWTPPLLAAGGAVFSVFATEEGASLFAQQIQTTGYSSIEPAVWSWIGAGIAMGGIGPLIATKALRAGIWLWLGQLALVLIWATAVS